MKSFSNVLMFTWLLLFFVGCSQSHTPPTQQEVLHLISAIPDHQLFPHTDNSFSRDYYSLLKEAWAIPSDGIGSIGSDEWLYYFISGNGDCDDFRIENINIVSQSHKAVVTFESFSCDTPSTHTMLLERQNHLWVIADYDSTFAMLKDYVNTQRKYFRSDEWQTYLDQALADPAFADLARTRQQEVEDYFNLYR